MTDDARDDVPDVPAGAEKALADQRLEIETLREQLADQTFARDLREALTVASAAGTLGSPVSHSQLLKMIVETATEVMDAESAVLLLLDEEGDELVFDVILGIDDQDVQGLRVPLGHGIAGLVAASGQPMAVSDAAGDPRVAPVIAESLSYVPQSILCVPLSYNDQPIGVLEVLDKDAGRSFTARDVETLGLFGRLAAVAIRQSRAHQGLPALLSEVLDSLGESGNDRESKLRNASAFGAHVETNTVYRRTAELTRLVHELSQLGEAELDACCAILQGFAGYLREQKTLRGDLMGPQ